MKESKYNIIQPLLLSIVLAVGMLVGYRLNEGSDAKLLNKLGKQSRKSSKTIEKVMGLIENKYLYKTNSTNFTDEAMKNIVDKLDPFSHYIDSRKYSDVSDRLKGHFTGLGIESLFVNDTFYIINVLKGSPADKAGLKSLDRVLQLGNVNISGSDKNVRQVRDLIKKYNNKDLDLIILNRENRKMPVTVKITSVEKNSINKDFLLRDSILYLAISQFTNFTYRDFMGTLEKYVNDDRLNSLVIDLRNNPGGYLREVTKILDQFFETSKLTIVKTVYKDGRQDITKTSGRNFYNIKNVAVLINGNSASGSEVLAGVLQDYDRAKIVGKQSFGKGLVQEQFDLDNGGALRLTIANYYLPTGRSIQKQLNLDSNFVDVFSSHYERKDTFYSLKNSRPLISGKGIIPDFEVDDSETIALDYLFWQKDSLFISWSIGFVQNHPGLLSIDENEFVKSYQPVVDTTYFAGKIDEDILKSKLFSRYLKAKIGFILFGYNTEGKILANEDPYIQKAVEVIKD